jgi:hypothetical protein
LPGKHRDFYEIGRSVAIGGFQFNQEFIGFDFRTLRVKFNPNRNPNAVTNQGPGFGRETKANLG